MTRFAFAILTLVAWPAGAFGQQEDSLAQPHAEYLERAYIFKNLPDSRTNDLFEGVLPLHIPLRQNLQKVYNQVLQPERKHHQTVSAMFSMTVNLRMTKESSAPVRTPSYMPKLTFTYFSAKRDQATTFPSSLPHSVSLWAVPFVPYGHYSNGQDGCLLASEEEIGETCTDTSTVPRPLEVNRRDGSFSSHYMQLGVFYRRITLSESASVGTEAVARSFWSFGGQVRAYQPYYWLGGGMSRQLRELYGPTRIRMLGNRIAQHRGGVFGPGQFRIEGFIEWLYGRADQVDPFRFSVEVARTMDKKSGWGVFVRAYSGQDDYNLGFLTNLRVLQVGATASGERMPYFRF